MSRTPEDFPTLYVDPGETTGWCLGQDLKLLAAGQTPMWEFSDEAWLAVKGDRSSLIFSDVTLRDEVRLPPNLNLGRIVCEDWRLYPDKLKALAWDQCRTARLIGALTFMARLHCIPLVLQAAAIKDRAVKGAAEEFFYTPLHPNRHQNDAIMHFTYFTQTVLLGMHYSGLDNLPGKPRATDE